MSTSPLAPVYPENRRTFVHNAYVLASFLFGVGQSAWLIFSHYDSFLGKLAYFATLSFLCFFIYFLKPAKAISLSVRSIRKWPITVWFSLFYFIYANFTAFWTVNPDFQQLNLQVGNHVTHVLILLTALSILDGDTVFKYVRNGLIIGAIIILLFSLLQSGSFAEVGERSNDYIHPNSLASLLCIPHNVYVLPISGCQNIQKITNVLHPIHNLARGDIYHH